MLKNFSTVLQQSSCKSIVLLALIAFLPFEVNTACATFDRITPCQIVWQYYRKTCDWDTGAIHIGIKNTSDHSVKIDKLIVDGKTLAWPQSFPNPHDAIEASKKRKRWYFPADVKGGDVMWFRFSRRIIPANKLTELIVKFQKPPQKSVKLQIETTTGEKICATVEPKVLPISITAITFSESLSRVYVYLKNLGKQKRRLKSIEINGQDKTMNATFVNKLISPNNSGCITIPVHKNLEKGDYVHITVKTEDGIITGNSIRAFSCFTINEQSESVQLKLFTNNPYGQLNLIARQIIQNCPILQGPEMVTYWSNQAFIKHGIMAFGELVDCARVHCQPSEVEYLGRYCLQDFHYVQAKTRYIREALAPRPVFPQTEVHHSLMNHDIQGLLNPIEMRLRVYYMISRGAKRIFYRGRLIDKSMPHQRRILSAEMNEIESELELLQPLLRIGENVDGWATCSEPLIEPSVLLCGEKAIVAILLNHDRQMSWPRNEMYLGKFFWIEPKPDTFQVDITIPPEVKVSQVFEIGGKWSQPSFDVKDHHCLFDVDGIISTRIFVLSFSGHIRNELIPQAVPATRSKLVQLKTNNNMEDIDLLVDKLVNTETIDAERSLWNPMVLTDLQEDIGGPDIQFEEKQYFFGQVAPSDKLLWHKFYYRNIGKLPLAVTLLEKPENSKVEIANALLSPGKRSHIKVGVLSSGGKIHSKVLLKTNDSNEEKVCLEIGANVCPNLVATPESLHFLVEPLSKETVKKTVRLIDNSQDNLNIQSVKTSSDFISCNLAPTRSDKVIVKSYADIFGGEYVQREFLLNVSLKKDIIQKNAHELVIVTTNRGDTLQIPVAIEVVEPVTCTPNRLFFGTISTPVAKSFKISSIELPFEIIDAYSDSSHIEVTMTEIKEQKSYEITATVGPTKYKGAIRGVIKIAVNCRDQEYSISVPYFALVQ